jgi:alkylated DNA repair dioxygenase AlkB
VIAAAYGRDVGYHPDTALVNYSNVDARLGMHQDKDKTVDWPVARW